MYIGLSNFFLNLYSDYVIKIHEISTNNNYLKCNTVRGIYINRL